MLVNFPKVDPISIFLDPEVVCHDGFVLGGVDDSAFHLLVVVLFSYPIFVSVGERNCDWVDGFVFGVGCVERIEFGELWGLH